MASDTVYNQTIRGPLGARVAFVDRRSLSQAWYSALHLAERGAPAAPRRTSPPAAATRTPRTLAVVQTRARLHADAAPLMLRSVGAGRSAAIAPAPTGRHARAAAAPIARAALRPRVPAAGTGMTFALGDARVHVLVRRAAGGVRVIALCARQHEATVRGALALAAAAGAPFERCSVVSIGGAP